MKSPSGQVPKVLRHSPDRRVTWGGVQVPGLTRPGRGVCVAQISEEGARGARLLGEELPRYAATASGWM
jgi:hypothetical protein